MKAVIPINDKVLNLVCFSIMVLILVFGLWPLNLNPANRVFWLPETPGVRFQGAGHIYIAGDLAPALSARHFSLEMRLRPAAEPNNRLPVIVALWDGRRQEVFLIGQWKDSPAIRVRTARPDVPRGYRERGKREVLVRGRTVFLAFTSSPAGTRLYLDGRPAAEWPGFTLLEDGPRGPAALILGNAAVGHSPWQGDLTGLGLFNRVLTEREVLDRQAAWEGQDYPFLRNAPGLIGLFAFREGQGNLIRPLNNGGTPILKPAAFHPLQKVVLEWPRWEQWKRWNFYQDVAVNILGFIPLGFFCTLWLLRFNPLSAARAAALTLFLGAAISLGIELTQVYLPSRDSQMSDLVCNMIGTVIGIALVKGVGDRV